MPERLPDQFLPNTLRLLRLAQELTGSVPRITPVPVLPGEVNAALLHLTKRGRPYEIRYR